MIFSKMNITFIYIFVHFLMTPNNKYEILLISLFIYDTQLFSDTFVYNEYTQGLHKKLINNDLYT